VVEEIGVMFRLLGVVVVFSVSVVGFMYGYRMMF